MNFVKLDAAGNDFIALDARGGEPLGSIGSGDIARWCDRTHGVGADGVLVLRPSEEAGVAYVLDFFNPDGSSAFCGNGSRAAFWWAQQLGGSSPELTFRAIDGLHRARNASVEVHCSQPPSATEHGFYVFSGTHHVVRLLANAAAVASIDLLAEAPAIRHHRDFLPHGVNVNVLGRCPDEQGCFAMRTFEKGVETETLSCGSGAVAAAMVLRAEGLATSDTVQLTAPGGPLSVTFAGTDIWLGGPVRMPLKGEIFSEEHHDS